jgi:hypothetical protein
MKKWLERHYATIALALSTAIVVALAFVLADKGYLDKARLAESKDALAALNSLVAILAVLLAFTLSYFRFFAGRTFARRADVEVTVEAALAPDGSSLHAISIRVANIGTLTIQTPELKLNAIDRLQDGSTTQSEVDQWLKNDAFASERLQPLIDPGETAHFQATRLVPAGAWATSYAAAIQDKNGNVWQSFALAKPPADKLGGVATGADARPPPRKRRGPNRAG